MSEGIPAQASQTLCQERARVSPKSQKDGQRGQIPATAFLIALALAFAFSLLCLPAMSLLLPGKLTMCLQMVIYWKRNERIEKERRKKAERELLEKRKKEEEAREARRQARKFNFLITQTELYAHFMSKKLGNGQSTLFMISL